MESFQSVKAVTPVDGTDLPSGCCWALMATGAGNVAVITENNETVVLPLGTIPLYIRVKQVRLTSTTATGIFALYSPIPALG